MQVPGDPTFDAVRSILLAAPGAFDAPPSFSALLKIPLSQPGKILGDSERPSWVGVVLATCAATGGDPAFGAQVAAGVECAMASLDLLDEIEDGDPSPTVEAAGMPQALNVSTALLLLGQRLLLDLPARDGLPTPPEFARTLTTGCLTATGGQHDDLAAEGYAASPEKVLAITRRKAGALAAAACRLGAMVGTADGDLLNLYARWGEHYGAAAQLANDLHDALDGSQKSDVARRKSTLPLLFSQRAADAAGQRPDVPASGALHFTWVVVEMERQACRDLVAELEARGQHVAPLRRFVA